MKILIGLYGRPAPELAPSAPNAVQFSPLIPGAERLEAFADAIFDAMTIVAPSGVLERRYVLAHALRVLAPEGRLTALAPKDRGGMRLGKELAAFGCAVEEVSRRHYRICQAGRPVAMTNINQAITAGAPQIPSALGLWSQPGIFSWDHPDPGSLALIDSLPPLAGAGADFGCGAGLLARAILESAAVTMLALVDIDRRAMDAAQRNIADPRAHFAWRDIRTPANELGELDFVVMNPPFHDGGAEDRLLGEAFIRQAAAVLRPGGSCWLVANRHLPYEAPLRTIFASVRQLQQDGGYKIYEVRR